MFKGIPEDAFDFFEALAANNTKGWWTENKARYEASVRGPIEALLADVAAEFGPAKIFRPYRDVRFAKDKTPYKTNIGATTTGTDGSVYYVALDASGMFAGTGYYRMARDQLERYRRAVGDERTGAELERLVLAGEKAGYEVGGEALKRTPKGFEQDHPQARLLKHKGVYLGRSFEPAAWMGTRKAIDRITKVWRDLQPVNDWFHAHVGPTTESWA